LVQDADCTHTIPRAITTSRYHDVTLLGYPDVMLSQRKDIV